MKTYRIEIEGLVQGVGFRPFVFRLASGMGLKGSVENHTSGVRIFLNSNNGYPYGFIDRLRSEAPLQSHIESVECFASEPLEFSDFSIVASRDISDEVTRISPDIAICSDCLHDLDNQKHRKGYPLINCTNCGPRFSIVMGVPYDRKKTTMSEFEMCTVCSTEYNNVYDRRFHAQPVACNQCGPRYRLNSKGETISGTEAIVKASAAVIESGGIVAVKGTGGYHLVCNAMNEKAVYALRHAKGREDKPFAVMCRDIEAVRQIAVICDGETAALASWQKPVMILEDRGVVAPSVSNGLRTVGVILPYMPFHYLLFRELNTSAIVFTSANMAGEPVITGDREAAGSLEVMCNAIVSYNREIYNRTDDSVARFIAGEPRLSRRSRGYAPSPVRTDHVTEGIFGAGAELSNCFAIGRNDEVILSQHIGDLRNSATMEFYESAYRRFSEMFRFRPSLLACDMHPDYLSSAFAGNLAYEKRLPLINVQHHHAHIASCMAENRTGGEVIGVAMDGVGLGNDGRIWGGEFMAADFCSFERHLHFEYVAIAGGDRVSWEPWRSGLSWLGRYCPEAVSCQQLPLIAGTGEEKTRLYLELAGKGINTMEYSSAGRLFDAVAAITGLDYVSKFHAEAPMRLESAVKHGIDRSYPFSISEGVISFGDTIRAIAGDVIAGRPAGEISAMFHNCVAEAIIQGTEIVSSKTGIKRVALSGGTFQNRYLTERVAEGLLSRGFLLFFHRNVPSNDGGLALGQIAVAAAHRAAGLV